ncbi:MAG: hypothetical protein J6T72_01665 [Alphaproteobacteria bacterium]|nr:hypothetical protein [Alphaproteobacteria bacterium]
MGNTQFSGMSISALREVQKNLEEREDIDFMLVHDRDPFISFDEFKKQRASEISAIDTAINEMEHEFDY